MRSMSSNAYECAAWCGLAARGAQHELPGGHDEHVIRHHISDNEHREHDRLLTPHEVAVFLGVPLRTMYRWRSRGDGPADTASVGTCDIGVGDVGDCRGLTCADRKSVV